MDSSKNKIMINNKMYLKQIVWWCKYYYNIIKNTIDMSIKKENATKKRQYTIITWNCINI